MKLNNVDYIFIKTQDSLLMSIVAMNVKYTL